MAKAQKIYLEVISDGGGGGFVSIYESNTSHDAMFGALFPTADTITNR